MAYDYEKSKALYEKLDPDKQKAFMEQNKNDANVQRFAKEYAAEKSSKTTSTATGSTTPTQTSTSTYSSSTVKPEYQWTWTNKSNTYSNQWEWTYSYNPTSWYYEKQWTTQNDNYSKIRNEWDSLTYAQQQEKLKQNPNLRAGVEKVGWTFKTEETTPTTPTTWTKTETTPKQWEWDYQDDSPERMAQIAQNLLEYKQTMPYLFDDKNAFDNFFINWKWRSAAQIRFLNDYFEANKKYWKYDTYTPEQAWYWIAYWDIPENYLTMLKATDPQRYQEVLQARQDAEDKIKNKSNLNSLISEAGMEDSDVTKWLKKEWFLVDENWDKVDDRLYIAPTEEEQKKVDRRNEILARKQEIKNMERNLLEDLTKQYPWVPRATLMWIVNDRMSDLQREYEDLSCEEAQLTWAIEYDQNERKAQMDAWLQTINNLQKEYGMYYDYTPEGMSQLAQAKYAATNVTLDQAENGTDTQKQMALEQTLTPIFEKYGSIIQRSMPQVINDVMKLAKDKWISLSDALEQNFLSYLRQKPEYKTLSSWGSLTADKWAKLNDNTLYNVTTWEIMSTDDWGTSYTTSWWATITPISSAANQEATKNLMNKYPSWSSYKNWECWELMNLDAANAGSNIHFWNDLSDKTKWINRETYEWPQVWDYVVFDWSNKPWASDKMRECWHVWKIVDVKDWSIYIRNQNWTVSWKVSIDKYPLKDYERYIAWYVDPTKTESYWYWGSPLDDQFAAIQNASSKLNKDQKEALDFADSAYMMMYKLANSWDLDYFLKSPDWQKVLSNYATAQFSNNANYTEDQILNTLKNNVTDQRILWIVNDLMTIIEKKLRWTSWAAISGSEWNSNSKMLIPQAWENYNTQFRKFQTFEWEYLKKPFDAMWRYAWVNVNYIPLFDWKSPYYTKYVVSAEQEADEAI